MPQLDYTMEKQNENEVLLMVNSSGSQQKISYLFLEETVTIPTVADNPVAPAS